MNKAPWGTTYFCFRVPSSVQLPNGDVLIFVESMIGSCHDQAPKDITMKRSTDFGRCAQPSVHIQRCVERHIVGLFWGVVLLVAQLQLGDR